MSNVQEEISIFEEHIEIEHHNTYATDTKYICRNCKNQSIEANKSKKNMQMIYSLRPFLKNGECQYCSAPGPLFTYSEADMTIEVITQ